MAAEPHIAQDYLYSQIEEAVDTGFKESGLVKEMASQGGPRLVIGLRGYVAILLAAFTQKDAMYGRYQTERAKFAALLGNYYFDAILGQIHAGDLALFHGGLFFGGVYRQEEAADAQKAYHDVAKLLGANREERSFFDFLSRNSLQVMEGMTFVAAQLNLPQPKETRLRTPKLEAYFGRN